MFIFKQKIFASYSDHDRKAIEPIIKLLRVARGWVFFAPDSISPGNRWEDHLHRAVKKCKLMVVFWCTHSQESEWVLREYTLAIDLEKKVVPVLLDNTQLPDALKVFQGIDFRGLGKHEEAKGQPSGRISSVASLISEGGFPKSGNYRNFARSKNVRRNASISMFGSLLLGLALFRPFPALISSEAITAFNFMVGFCGLILICIGTAVRFRAINEIATNDDQEKLAASLDTMLRRNL